MESFKIILAIIAFASVALSSTAAPATVISNTNPSQRNTVVTVEPLSESIAITPKPSHRRTPILVEEVKTLERFFRIYEDGTLEFKIVLSNGLAQFQKITNKKICDDTIQVYEGYNSERLPDDTYRTTHYVADERGYRVLRREFDTKPPVLPVYVPHVPKVPTPTESIQNLE